MRKLYLEPSPKGNILVYFFVRVFIQRTSDRGRYDARVRSSLSCTLWRPQTPESSQHLGRPPTVFRLNNFPGNKQIRSNDKASGRVRRHFNEISMRNVRNNRRYFPSLHARFVFSLSLSHHTSRNGCPQTRHSRKRATTLRTVRLSDLFNNNTKIIIYMVPVPTTKRDKRLLYI